LSSGRGRSAPSAREVAADVRERHNYVITYFSRSRLDIRIPDDKLTLPENTFYKKKLCAQNLTWCSTNLVFISGFAPVTPIPISS